MPEPPNPRNEYRKCLADALQAASRDYDQAVLTLATGSLALSVTFAHDIAPTPTPGSHVFFVAAWLLLGGSMLAMVGSFVRSQRTIRKMIADLDRDPGGDNDGDSNANANKVEVSSRWTRLIDQTRPTAAAEVARLVGTNVPVKNEPQAREWRTGYAARRIGRKRGGRAAIEHTSAAKGCA